MAKNKAEKKAREKARRAALTPEERAKEDKVAKKIKIIVATILILPIVIGLLLPDTESGVDESASSTSITSDNSGVKWSDYSPTVKTRIEGLIQSGDCSSLQAEFDIADQNDAAQRNRVGTGNADLMNYINTSMQKLGCL
jgi:hypothetical protein